MSHVHVVDNYRIRKITRLPKQEGKHMQDFSTMLCWLKVYFCKECKRSKNSNLFVGDSTTKLLSYMTFNLHNTSQNLRKIIKNEEPNM